MNAGKPELTKLQSGAEKATIYTNVRSWLANTMFNIPTILGPNHRKVVADHETIQGQVKAMASEVRQLADLRELADPEKRTVFILASGASLRRHESFLAKLNRYGYVIASPTTLPWACAQGLEPDLVVNVDAHPVLAEYAESSGAHTYARLVTTSESSPRLVNLFPRERVHWFRSAIPGPDGSLDYEPYSVFHTFLLSAINSRIAQMGCVTNSAVGVALALRDHAGWDWDQIVLLGADYGKWGRYARLPRYADEEFPTEEPGNAQPIKLNGVETTKKFARYKASLMLLWMRVMPMIYTMSHGILTEFPRVSERNIIRDKWPDYPGSEGIRRAAVPYLKWFQGAYRKDEEEAERERQQQMDGESVLPGDERDVPGQGVVDDGGGGEGQERDGLAG